MSPVPGGQLGITMSLKGTVIHHIHLLLEVLEQVREVPLTDKVIPATTGLGLATGPVQDPLHLLPTDLAEPALPSQGDPAEMSHLFIPFTQAGQFPQHLQFILTEKGPGPPTYLLTLLHISSDSIPHPAPKHPLQGPAGQPLPATHTVPLNLKYVRAIGGLNQFSQRAEETIKISAHRLSSTFCPLARNLMVLMVLLLSFMSEKHLK